MPPYTIQEHRHRFAVWTAGRAVARDFTSAQYVEKAIKAAGLREAIETDRAFKDQNAFDEWHCVRCKKILAYWEPFSLNTFEKSKTDKGVKSPSFGRAAKVIAIYLKTMIGLGEVDAHPMQKHMHPPIDRILLDNMRTELGYTIKELPKWTQLTDEQYADVLDIIS